MRFSMSLLLLSLASIHAIAQQANAPAALPEIHISGDCRISFESTPDKKPRSFRNSAICRQESEHHSVLQENTVTNGVLTTMAYKVNEVEYVLFNGADHPVAFLIDQRLPEGWRVDSTPQPIAFEEGIATFRVVAKSWETVRLHTGQRRPTGHASSKTIEQPPTQATGFQLRDASHRLPENPQTP